MNEIDLKELFKVAVETLREKTIRSLLEADMTYQKDSENEGIAEKEYLLSIPWLQSHSIRYREPSIPNDRAT